LALEKKEFLVEQAERNIASSTADLTRREQVLAESYAKLVAERATLESERAVASEDARIQMLISEFSALGVNLNDNHHCLSGDALIRYNAAFSKFSAITALVRASSLANKYAVFISQNQRNTSDFISVDVMHDLTATEKAMALDRMSDCVGCNAGNLRRHRNR
jgi:hypothetical protein